MTKMKCVVAAFLLAGSGFAHSNLIVNGGFEEPGIKHGWTYGQDPTGSWQGDNIEVWATGFLGVDSHEGRQHAELNAHPYHKDVWSINQSFKTLADSLYEVSFAYQARRSNTESFLFELFGDNNESSTALFAQSMTDHVTGQWSMFSHKFEGTGDLMKLQFTSQTPEKGTVGNFLDAVSVTELRPQLTTLRTQDVPAPPALALMGIGLAGLGFSRRSKRTA